MFLLQSVHFFVLWIYLTHDAHKLSFELQNYSFIFRNISVKIHSWDVKNINVYSFENFNQKCSKKCFQWYCGRRCCLLPSSHVLPFIVPSRSLFMILIEFSAFFLSSDDILSGYIARNTHFSGIGPCSNFFCLLNIAATTFFPKSLHSQS